ncbi:MAG: hypothetical protein M1557_00555 [Actinobacteria bacterium]|nr:hypothetical protein [Actinomycetota bacterium]
MRAVLGLALTVGLSVTLAACGSSTSVAKHAKGKGARRALPTAIVPVSRGAEALGPLQSNGLFAVLAGNASAQGVFSYDLANHTEVDSFSVSNLATSVTELPSGVIAVGLAGNGVGAVDLYSGSGHQIASIPVADPVRALAVGGDGATIYVLMNSSGGRAVAVLDATTRLASTTIPVDSQTVAVAPSLHDHELYGLDATGSVSVYATSTGQRIGSFAVGHSGVDLVLSPNGTQLYVLKGRGGIRNVAVVDLATERDIAAVAAPAGSVSLQAGLSGHHLLELASIASAANVQELPVS